MSLSVKEYANGIKFGSAQPDDIWCKLEIENTLLPEPVPGLDVICQVPNMSSPAIGAIINKVVQQMPADECYVNIGFWYGYSLFAGMLNNPDKTCIGVDNFSQFNEHGNVRPIFEERFRMIRSDNHLVFESSYQDYFKSFHKDRKIGFYYYDAEHSYEGQLEGLKLAEPYLADGAYIMVDDTNQPDPRKATFDFIEQSKNEWEVVLDVKCAAFICRATWWNGTILLRKGGLKPDEKAKESETATGSDSKSESSSQEAAADVPRDAGESGGHDGPSDPALPAQEPKAESGEAGQVPAQAV